MEISDFDNAVMLDTDEPMIDDTWMMACDECGNTIIHKDGCSKKEEVIIEER